jgi:hypothetical protein
VDDRGCATCALCARRYDVTESGVRERL